MVALEVFRGGKPNARRMLLGIAKNPLILATLTGLVFLLLDLSLPQVIVDALDDISQWRRPLSLVVLGGSFEFSKLRGSLREMTVGILGRLVLVPAVFLPLFAFLGFRGAEMGAALVMLASPTAVPPFQWPLRWTPTAPWPGRS